MISNFLFSLDVALPIFMVMFIGIVFKKRNIINEEFINRANSLLFNVALPAKLFLDIAQCDIKEIMNVKFIVFAIIATTIGFIGIWIIGEIFIKENTQIGAFVHGAYRGNFVYIGLALAQNILGKGTVLSAALIVAFVLPLYNILAVIVLAFKGEGGNKVSLRNILIDIIRNPMILAIAAALPFSLLRVSFPFAVTQSLNYLGQIATPLSLILIGASVEIKAIKEKILPILGACLYKLVIQPLLFIPLALMFGFNQEEIVVLFVLFSVPTAMNVYIMTKKMGGDSDLGSGIIVMSVLLSVITLPTGIFVLKGIGIV